MYTAQSALRGSWEAINRATPACHRSCSGVMVLTVKLNTDWRQESLVTMPAGATPLRALYARAGATSGGSACAQTSTAYLGLNFTNHEIYLPHWPIWNRYKIDFKCVWFRIECDFKFTNSVGHESSLAR